MLYRGIVAIDEAGGIGNENDLPWPRIRKDMKRFQNLTVGSPVFAQKNIVIMGRKTMESIPSKFFPLSDRESFILTRDPEKYREKYKDVEDVSFFSSYEEIQKEIAFRDIKAALLCEPQDAIRKEIKKIDKYFNSGFLIPEDKKLLLNFDITKLFGYEVFVAGGADIYNLFSTDIVQWDVTMVHGTYPADTFFPNPILDWEKKGLQMCDLEIQQGSHTYMSVKNTETIHSQFKARLEMVLEEMLTSRGLQLKLELDKMEKSYV